jgi:hypothetical protein
LGNSAYSFKNQADEVGQGGVDVVDDKSHLVRLTGTDVAGHVLLEHSLDVAACRSVALEDGLAAEQTSFLSRVPVELDGVGGLASGDTLVAEEDAERL